MFTSILNITWTNSSHVNNLITKHISSFTIIQRTIFILSIVMLFWIVFIVIYLISRLIIRLISKFKRFRSSPTSTKVCQAFVISSNQYGSFRPMQTLYHSDSLFSGINFALSTEKINRISNYGTINLTINLLENSDYKTSLLEHYLKTYNPLQIDFTDSQTETIISTSNIKVISDEELPSETDTRPIDNCYALHCTNKQNFRQPGRYARLKEQENCSATRSLADERLSECSTKLTSTTLPVVMITDCSNSQRLHTDIIEMNEEE